MLSQRLNEFNINMQTEIESPTTASSNEVLIIQVDFFMLHTADLDRSPIHSPAAAAPLPSYTHKQSGNVPFDQ